MQFVPGVNVNDPNAMTKHYDITFCEHKESDPDSWEDQYIGLLEEYITCFGENHLLKSGVARAELLALVKGMGLKYNNADLIDDIVRARTLNVSTASGRPKEDISSDETAIIDRDSLLPVSSRVTTYFMSTMRLLSLEVLKDSDLPSYELKKALWLQSYERIKFVFESRTAKVLTPPSYICFTSSPSPSSVSLYTLEERTKEQLKVMYNDLYYVNVSAENGCCKEAFLSRWFADEHKRVYETFLFDPRRALPNNFNTFFGLRGEALPLVIDEVKARDHMNLILNHIKEVYCENNEDHAQYFYKWMANIVKYPWSKTQVLMLIFGIEGCGKGLIIDFFANQVLGRYLSFHTASPALDLFSRFGVASYRKLLCFCDEASNELADPKIRERVKDMVTNPFVRVELKGQNIRTEENYTNIIVVSNNTWTLDVSSNDRRVVAFQCDEKYKGNYQYFNKLVEATKNDDCARMMYEFLKSYDLPPDFNFQENRPITTYYESLQVASLPIFFRFLSYQCIAKEEARVKLQSKNLYSEFAAWKTERGFESSYTSTKFGIQLSHLLNDEKSGVKKSKSGSMLYEINFAELRTYLILKKKFDEDAF